MFFDTQPLKYVRDGGNGCVFRRKYIPNGDLTEAMAVGGDVILRVDEASTLQEYRFRHHFAAENGVPGKGSEWPGSRVKSYLTVPGTLVFHSGTKELIADLREVAMK